MTPIHSLVATLALLIALVAHSSLSAAEPHDAKLNSVISRRALDQLQSALKNEKEFVKVHAAEALIRMWRESEVLPVFVEEQKLHGNDPHYRIGIWRVLVRSSSDTTAREQYLKKLRDVSLDAKDPDRITATESLAKLKYKIRVEDRPQYEAFAKEASADGVHFYRWLLAESDKRDIPFLAELLDSSSPQIRGITAYGLWHLSDRVPPEIINKLSGAARTEPESKYRVYLYIASFVVTRDPDVRKHFKDLLVAGVAGGTKDEKYQTAMGLALRGAAEDLPLLGKLLDDPEADVRVSAAGAILAIQSRTGLFEPPQRTAPRRARHGILHD